MTPDPEHWPDRDSGARPARSGDVLSRRPRARVPLRGGTLAFFTCGDVRLMLGVPENDAVDHESSTVYFRVPDLQGAYEELIGTRRAVRRRAAPDRRASRPRAVDGLLP